MGVNPVITDGECMRHASDEQIKYIIKKIKNMLWRGLKDTTSKTKIIKIWKTQFRNYLDKTYDTDDKITAAAAEKVKLEEKRRGSKYNQTDRISRGEHFAAGIMKMIEVVKEKILKPKWSMDE